MTKQANTDEQEDEAIRLGRIDAQQAAAFYEGIVDVVKDSNFALELTVAYVRTAIVKADG